MRLVGRRLAAAAAATTASAALLYHQRQLAMCKHSRYQDVPERHEAQRHTPLTPYPGWDSQWDYLTLTPKQVAAELGHSYPIGA